MSSPKSEKLGQNEIPSLHDITQKSSISAGVIIGIIKAGNTRRTLKEIFEAGVTSPPDETPLIPLDELAFTFPPQKPALRLIQNPEETEHQKI